MPIGQRHTPPSGACAARSIIGLHPRAGLIFIGADENSVFALFVNVIGAVGSSAWRDRHAFFPGQLGQRVGWPCARVADNFCGGDAAETASCCEIEAVGVAEQKASRVEIASAGGVDHLGDRITGHSDFLPARENE